MHLAGLITGAACLAVWAYLLVLHGGFWRVWRLQAPILPPSTVDGGLAVVIPARDEADHIAAAVRSLLEQQFVKQVHVFVVDDHSSDGTAQVARQSAQGSDRQGSLTVITGSVLPAGWTGKLWAAQQGIHQALRLNPQILLLTDADIVHSPDNVATLVSI